MPPKDREAYNAYMKEYMLRRYEKRRQKAIIQLGGKCVTCGSQAQLEIHHIDPSTKSFTLATGSSYSEKRWQEELAKCQILCDPCHKKEHASKYPCGTPQRYWTGCRCDLCTVSNSEYHKQYRLTRKGM